MESDAEDQPGDSERESHFRSLSGNLASIAAPPPPPSSPIPKAPPKEHCKIYSDKAVSLYRDHYGTYNDEHGDSHEIFRYTWRNYNKIEIQMINYGARMIAVKLPDKTGTVVDVLLGYDDLAGYIYYQQFPLGATLGRCANVIRDGIFMADSSVYHLSQNIKDDHLNGGYKGFDKVVWNSYSKGSEVIMSYISKAGEEGYPGDLFIQISFNLCNRNEFKMQVTAKCTQPTIINISHFNYFNLAGHNKGSDEAFRHVLTLNCNCYTVQENGIPTGEIRNVIHSPMDFQIPKVMREVIGITPRDGFDVNLCVNRGIEQGLCFVSRLVHYPSGRLIEMYSDQPGVQLTTANEFGCGEVIPLDILVTEAEHRRECAARALFIERIYRKAFKLLCVDDNQDFIDIRELIEKVKQIREEDVMSLGQISITPLQSKYLEGMLQFCKGQRDNEYSLDLKAVIEAILLQCTVRSATSIASKGKKRSSVDRRRSSGSSKKVSITGETQDSGLKNDDGSPPPLEEDMRVSQEKSRRLSEQEQSIIVERNDIPKSYKDGRIHGKMNVIYKTHDAISIRPQNYPNAANIKCFPNCVLRPGETYSTTTVYKFWIRAGNPNTWVKRYNFNDKLRSRLPKESKV